MPRGEAHAQEEERSFVPDAHFAAPPEAPLQLLRGGGLTPAVSSLFMSSHLEQLRGTAMPHHPRQPDPRPVRSHAGMGLGVELPATAVERRRRVEALVLHVHRQAGTVKYAQPWRLVAMSTNTHYTSTGRLAQ